MATKAEMTELEQLRKLVEELQEKINTKPVQDEKIVLRFQAECASSNKVIFGPNGIYGQITGKTGMVTVPKSQWSQFYDESIQNMLKRRVLIVLSGLTDEERDIYGVNYKEGELLDQKAFAKMLDMGEELLTVFPNLCEEHQKMIAKRFIEAAGKDDPRALNRDLIVKLNNLSKKQYADLPAKNPKKKGMFYSIIEKMNRKDAEQE